MAEFILVGLEAAEMFILNTAIFSACLLIRKPAVF